MLGNRNFKYLVISEFHHFSLELLVVLVYIVLFLSKGVVSLLRFLSMLMDLELHVFNLDLESINILDMVIDILGVELIFFEELGMAGVPIGSLERKKESYIDWVSFVYF